VLQINGSEIRNGRQTLGSLGVQEKDIVVLSRATNSAPLHSTQNINPNVNETSLTASTVSPHLFHLGHISFQFNVLN
jgi:hypothetical protein